MIIIIYKLACNVSLCKTNNNIKTGEINIIYAFIILGILIIFIINTLTTNNIVIKKKIKDNFDPLSVQSNIGAKKLLDDPVFSDLVVYDNDSDAGGRIGLDKCLEYCKGTCVEYGVTGSATCFPAENKVKANYYTSMRNEENEADDDDAAGDQMKYPGMR
jgi:hypothetical protein